MLILTGLPKCLLCLLQFAVEMAAPFILCKIKRPCHVFPFKISSLVVYRKVNSVKTFWHFLQDLQRLCTLVCSWAVEGRVPVRTLESCYSPTLATPLLKLKIVSDWSAGPRAWSSVPLSLRTVALACTDATPGTVSAPLLRRCLIATYSMASHLSHLHINATSVLGKSIRVECRYPSRFCANYKNSLHEELPIVSV